MQHVMKDKSIQCLCILTLLITGMLLYPRIGGTGETGPTESIQTLNAALLDAMKRADDLGYEGRYKLLEPVIRDTFAFTFMGARSVGKFWDTMSDSQRKTFIDTYTDWSIATYAGRFDGYSGERFDLISQSPPSQGTVSVIVKLVQVNEPPITFNYLMKFLEDHWRIVDIQVAGVSQLALTRAQFTDVLKNKNYDALISLLKSKIAGFANAKKK